MLGLAEYTVASTDLWTLAVHTQEQLSAQLYDGMPRSAALKLAERFGNEYYTGYQQVLRNGLEDVADNAISYYGDELGMEIDNRDDLIDKLVTQNYSERYYGASLRERLKFNHKKFMRNIVRSSLWATVLEGSHAGLHRLFTSNIPYGSQYNIDRRVLLSMAVKIEQDTAKLIADEIGARLIKWTLSPAHPKPDICDDMATATNKDVVRYIEKNNLKVDPKGLFFIENLPHPPHPNCQCEYGIVQGTRITGGPVRRTLSKITKLLRRLRGK